VKDWKRIAARWSEIEQFLRGAPKDGYLGPLRVAIDEANEVFGGTYMGRCSVAQAEWAAAVRVLKGHGFLRLGPSPTDERREAVWKMQDAIDQGRRALAGKASRPVTEKLSIGDKKVLLIGNSFEPVPREKVLQALGSYRSATSRLAHIHDHEDPAALIAECESLFDMACRLNPRLANSASRYRELFGSIRVYAQLLCQRSIRENARGNVQFEDREHAYGDELNPEHLEPDPEDYIDAVRAYWPAGSRVNRSAAAKKAWATRRLGVDAPEPRPYTKERLARIRSNAVKKAWATRKSGVRIYTNDRFRNITGPLEEEREEPGWDMYEDEAYAEKLVRGFSEDQGESSSDEVPF